MQKQEKFLYKQEKLFQKKLLKIFRIQESIL